MNRIEKAFSRFNEGFSCSQSILSTYGEDYGLNRDLALRIATPFGGGIGRMGEICGAVTGAFMVIGLKHGVTSVDDIEAKEKAYDLTREFTDNFKSRNKAITCKELLGCDIGKPEGMNFAKEKDLFNVLCPRLVRDAAEILEQILD
jgi:C_GCAxxG_C_C family probable redox protein